MKIRLSDLRALRIVDDTGDKLGHFADLRCHGRRRPDGGQARATADRVVWGVVGLLERLGVRALADKTIDWRNVVAIERGRIVVRASRAAKRRR
jgi:hypothetical protein